MQEHEYRARDKTVKKMSRDGLKEENLHSRKSIRVSTVSYTHLEINVFCSLEGCVRF